MSTGPFLVGLIISTVNVSLVLRQIKYRSELLAYGYSEENRPFSSSTPFTDARDYRMEMWYRIRQHENSTVNDLTLYSHTITTNIKDAIDRLAQSKSPWS